MFDDATVAAVAAFAARLNVEPAALLAVAEVEAAGQTFALVRGKREPLIRWEGHYFDQRLTGAKRDRARREKLASPKAGGIANPRSQAARWDLVHRAALIDRQAALESFSIGLGQVMTAHWKRLGFRSVDEMIRTGRSGVIGQIELMVAYIDKFGLADELRRLDFTAFARGYNGPGYAKNRYHLKMAEAYKRHSGRAPASRAAGMLRMGAKGERVRALQTLLVRAGHAVRVDGDYGPSTRDAVKAFQKANRITADGVAGPETMRRLEAFKQGIEERPGAQGVTETSQAKEGLGGVAGGVGVEAARQAIEEAADKTSWVPGLEWLSAVLSTVAVLLVLGGLAWIAWGWWKARQTDEGDIAPAPDLEPAAHDEVLA